MISDIIDSYKKFRAKNTKKGYKVIGIQLTILFFLLMFFTIFNFYYIFYYSYWLIVTEIVLLLILLLVNKKVDKLLNENWRKNKKLLIGYVNCYLEEAKFSQPEQYIRLSRILKERSKLRIRKYDITNYLMMVLTIIVFTLGIFSNDISTSMIITIGIIFTTLIVSINPIINMFTNMFLNQESEIINELAEIIEELYFKLSIKESM